MLWVFDIRRTFDRLDVMLLDWLKANRLEFSLVLTKADKEGRGASLQKKQAFQAMLGREEVFLFSSKDGYGKSELSSISDCLSLGPALFLQKPKSLLLDDFLRVEIVCLYVLERDRVAHPDILLEIGKGHMSCPL